MPLFGLMVAAPPRLLLNPAAARPLVSLIVTAVVVPLLRIARNVTTLPLEAQAASLGNRAHNRLKSARCRCTVEYQPAVICHHCLVGPLE